MSLKVENKIKLDVDPCVLAWDNKLFVGTEDGYIKSYDEKLSADKSWSAHAAQPFALEAAAGRVYSASNDGGVRVWSSQGDKLAEYPPGEGDVETIHVHANNVITGDEVGNVTVYEDDSIKAKYNVLEEVKGLQFKPPYLYTARDLYVTVTEIKPEESKTRFVTRHTMEGRAPMRIVGDKILLVARDGNNLRLHYATADNGFKLLHEVKVSDMIVTSLAVEGDYAWTGGWDGHVRRWKLTGDKLQLDGDINLEGCVNAIVAQAGTAYAAVAGGNLALIKAS